MKGFIYGLVILGLIILSVVFFKAGLLGRVRVTGITAHSEEGEALQDFDEGFQYLSRWSLIGDTDSRFKAAVFKLRPSWLRAGDLAAGEKFIDLMTDDILRDLPNPLKEATKRTIAPILNISGVMASKPPIKGMWAASKYEVTLRFLFDATYGIEACEREGSITISVRVNGMYPIPKLQRYIADKLAESFIALSGRMMKEEDEITIGTK